MSAAQADALANPVGGGKHPQDWETGKRGWMSQVAVRGALPTATTPEEQFLSAPPAARLRQMEAPVGESSTAPRSNRARAHPMARATLRSRYRRAAPTVSPSKPAAIYTRLSNSGRSYAEGFLANPMANGTATDDFQL